MTRLLAAIALTAFLAACSSPQVVSLNTTGTEDPLWTYEGDPFGCLASQGTC